MIEADKNRRQLCYSVQVSVNEWLSEIGLSMYGDNFRRNQIRVPKEMEILKSLSRKDIERELGIAKDGELTQSPSLEVRGRCEGKVSRSFS